jgi:hypothetical protein
LVLGQKELQQVVQKTLTQLSRLDATVIAFDEAAPFRFVECF